ncbi:hypothetical protein EDB19DRAFT_2025664 [Suillus lakei]|nr:hypothetical protein EDB19DRAFT_2025664 [Suillus lakei]
MFASSCFTITLSLFLDEERADAVQELGGRGSVKEEHRTRVLTKEGREVLQVSWGDHQMARGSKQPMMEGVGGRSEQRETAVSRGTRKAMVGVCATPDSWKDEGQREVASMTAPGLREVEGAGRGGSARLAGARRTSWLCASRRLQETNGGTSWAVGSCEEVVLGCVECIHEGAAVRRSPHQGGGRKVGEW